MKKQRIHINRILSALLLLVFSIALTPWSALHHHPQVIQHPEKEKICTHKLHLSSHTDNCLVCAAHFEKNFVQTTAVFRVFLSMKSWIKEESIIGNTYTELLHTSLRGPPLS